MSRLIIVAVCLYLIKVNPFYRTYPIMLPISTIAMVLTFISIIRYSRKTNSMVQQILMDQTGSELTFVYQNQMQRKLRTDPPEVTLMIQSMQNPPQQGKFRQLQGDLFPEQYPFQEP